MREYIKAGIFCAILVMISFLLCGLVGRALALDPLVSFATAAGVLAPSLMVASGGLGRWSVYDPFSETPQAGWLTASITSGLVTVACSAIVCFALSLYSGSIFAFTGRADALLLPGTLLLLAAYLALSVIGGGLYGIVFPDEKGLRF